MQEYKNGSYGDIGPVSEIFAKLRGDPVELETTASVHFGSVEELTAKKMEPAVLERLDKLEKKINCLLLHFGLADKGEILVVLPGAAGIAAVKEGK